MELVFVRHGETEFNKHHHLMGQRIDAPLDSKGLAQAHEVISKLPRKFSIIYSSPLKRAIMTAQIIADYFDADVIARNELRERDFGSLSGKTWDEIDRETGMSFSKLDQDLSYDYTKFGGESAQQVKGRLSAFLDEIRSKHRPDETIVVVTHFGIISMMNSMYPNKEHIKLMNVSVHKFEI